MRTTSLRFTAILAAAALLAACSTATGDAPEPTAEPATAATELPTPTPEPTPEVVEAAVGDTVTEDEAELLPEGQTAYPLEDGTLVVVDANEPLPEPLVQEVYNKISTEVDADLAFRGEGSTVDAVRQAKEISQATGRHVILVTKTYAFSIDREVEATYWSPIASGPLYSETHSDFTRYSREGAIARAEELAAENEGYEVIVHEG